MTFFVAVVHTVNSKSDLCAPLNNCFIKLSHVFVPCSYDRKLTDVEKELLDLLRGKISVDKTLRAGQVRVISQNMTL